MVLTASRLDLSDNKVKGVFGKSNAGKLTALTNLLELSIASNNLKGKVPQELSALEKLTKLDVSGNKFSGRIPGVVTKFSLLKCVVANAVVALDHSCMQRCSLKRLSTVLYRVFFVPLLLVAGTWTSPTTS